MAVHNLSDPPFVRKNGGVDPRVPRLVPHDDGSTLGTKQLTVSKNLKVTVHEMTVRAVFILCTRRQANRHVWVQSAEFSDGRLLMRGAIPEVPVKLFVDVGREQFVRR